MNAQELRCPGCFAPMVPTGAISKCRYCGATIAIPGAMQGALQGPPMAPPMPHGGSGDAPVFLEDPGGNKLEVIKVIRQFTGLGLREAKELCERAPCVVANWPTEALKMGDFRIALARAGARVR